MHASIVVPFFNPGDRLRSTLEQLATTLTLAGKPFEIIAVSDGSTDGSSRDLRDHPVDGVRLVELDRNYGKGEALRAGMRMGRGRFVGFVDADGDIPPHQVAEFVRLAEESGADVVLGSKVHAGSSVRSPVGRRYLSAVWRVMVRVLFQLPVSDSQTGIKVFRHEVIARSLPRTAIKGFTFDVELLVVAYDLGFRSVVEAPVEIAERSGSTVSVRRASRMFWDLVGLFWRLRVLRRPKRTAET